MPAPSSLPFTSTGGLPRPNFRFEGPPRGRSAPFGRSEAGARVCVKSKRSEILLGENVQKEGRSTRGGIEGKERKTYALLRKFGKVSRTGKRSGRGRRTLSGCGVGTRGGRFRKAKKEEGGPLGMRSPRGREKRSGEVPPPLPREKVCYSELSPNLHKWGLFFVQTQDVVFKRHHIKRLPVVSIKV